MVWEVDKCPECGSDQGSGNGSCPLCGPDLRAGRTGLGRSRRKRITVLIALLCAAIFLLVIWPIVSSPPPPDSIKLIITADELGPGWTGSRPETDPLVSEGPNPAMVRLAYGSGSLYFMVTCRLYVFPTTDLANESYCGWIEGVSAGSMENVTVGDRAVIATYLNESGEAGLRNLAMQKGSSILWIVSPDAYGPAMEETHLIALAEAQAAKLP